MLFLRSRAATAAAFTALLTLGACGDDPAEVIPGAGDPENISNVTLTLVPVGGGTTLVSTIRDPDGTQLPQPPGVPSATLALRQGVTYNASIDLLNDLDPDNVVSTTEEIEEEADFHRLFYTFSCTGVTAPVASFNQDNQSPAQPLGTTFQVVVAADAPTTTTCQVQRRAVTGVPS
jgi:hypothetical protein